MKYYYFFSEFLFYDLIRVIVWFTVFGHFFSFEIIKDSKIVDQNFFFERKYR